MITPEQFKTILDNHNRVAIVGGPKTGKTTLSNLTTDRPVHHDNPNLSWGEQTLHIKMKATQPKFVVEGVHVARALRRGLEVDAIVHLREPLQDLTAGQLNMHKGQQTIIKSALSINPNIPVYE